MAILASPRTAYQLKQRGRSAKKKKNISSRQNSVTAVSDGQTTSPAMDLWSWIYQHSKQGPSLLHHTFLLRRACFIA